MIVNDKRTSTLPLQPTMDKIDIHYFSIVTLHDNEMTITLFSSPYTAPAIVQKKAMVTSCSPIGDVPKHERADQHADHEGGLAHLGQPFPITHQVPVGHDVLLHLAVVEDELLLAGYRRFAAIKLIGEEVRGVDAQCALAPAQLPLVPRGGPDCQVAVGIVEGG